MAIFTAAKARAAAGGSAARPYSRIIRRVCSFQSAKALRPPKVSQYIAMELVFGVRLNAFSSSSSAFSWGESQAGGAGGRKASGVARTQVFQVAVAGLTGFVPFHLPGPSGTVPVHLRSDPSILARSIARAAIR